MKNGFTLLELSIVLVIIGLIIGGITVGQELIRGAELSKVGSDVNKVRTAINTFKLKYNALPGDMDNAFDYWGTDCGTDTNNVSASCNGNGTGTITTSNEVVEFAHHLSLSEIITGDFSGTFGAGTAVDPTFTDELIETSLFAFIRPWNSATAVHTKNNTNHLSISGLTALGATGVGFLTPADATSLDEKMDDGAVNTGKYYISGCTAGTAAAPTIDLSLETPTCILTYWLD